MCQCEASCSHHICDINRVAVNQEKQNRPICEFSKQCWKVLPEKLVFCPHILKCLLSCCFSALSAPHVLQVLSPVYLVLFLPPTYDGVSTVLLFSWISTVFCPGAYPLTLMLKGNCSTFFLPHFISQLIIGSSTHTHLGSKFHDKDQWCRRFKIGHMVVNGGNWTTWKLFPSNCSQSLLHYPVFLYFYYF